MNVKYKVVRKNRTSSSNWINPLLVRKYEKGSIVKSYPGSPGILVFKRKIDAKKFIDENRFTNSCMIIRVKSIGRGRKLSMLLVGMGSSCIDHIKRLFLKFRQKDNSFEHIVFYTFPAPSGTYGYPAVEVLD